MELNEKGLWVRKKKATTEVGLGGWKSLTSRVLWQAVKAFQEDQDGCRTISRDYEIGIELQKLFFSSRKN